MAVAFHYALCWRSAPGDHCELKVVRAIEPPLWLGAGNDEGLIIAAWANVGLAADGCRHWQRVAGQAGA
eukprot:10998655-Alexandrium_andersonii.AAC.1